MVTSGGAAMLSGCSFVLEAGWGWRGSIDFWQAALSVEETEEGEEEYLSIEYRK
jgi:hypothetical protein